MKIENYIEHTILKANTSIQDIENVCNEALNYNFFAVCIPSYFIKKAKSKLSNSNVKIVTVVGFPLGYSSTKSKVIEAVNAIEDGADEIDMVINIAALKDGDYDFVLNDIKSVCIKVHKYNSTLKVIIETALLTKKEKLKALELCIDANVDFVKTSTGFSTSGANVEDIKLFRNCLPSNISIKASGGIKTKRQAITLINSGAIRLGTSSSIKLL